MYLEEFAPGMEFPIAPVLITKEQMIAFAKTYDPFPLHYDEDYARATRFGQLIAPGVMSFMAVWAKFMSSGVLGPELIAGKNTRIEWFSPVYADDILTGTARVTAVSPRNAHNGAVELTIDVKNQRGELVLTDVTESIVARRPESEGP